MSKHNRTEVVKVLRQQMEAATDPKEKVELAKQLAKLLPRPRQARRPRKSEATPAAPPNKKISILKRVTGTAVDQLSDGEKVRHHLMVEVEKRQRERRQKFTKDEVSALLKELVESLSAHERAALDVEDAEVA